MLKEHPGAKLAVLYRNDDFGKDYVTGLRDVLGKDSDKYVVRTATNEVTDPIVNSQISDLHAVVAEGSLLVVAVDVVQAANYKQQLEPMLNQIVAMIEVLGKAETMLADNGYLSAANVAACEAAAVQPLIAKGREAHHPSLSERFAGAPPPPENPTPVEAMAYRLATPEARSSIAAQTNAGTGVRHHQVDTVPAARDRQGAWRVESRDHGPESEADAHPLLRPVRRGEGLLPQNEGECDRCRPS